MINLLIFVAHSLDEILKGAHPVASLIRHLATWVDRPPSDTPPLDPDNLPGDYDAALEAICEGPCPAPTGALPEDLAIALTPALWAMKEAADVHFEAHFNALLRPASWWRDNGANLLLATPGAPSPDMHDDAVLSLLLGHEHLPRFYEAASRIAYAVEHADLRRFSSEEAASYEQSTPLGWIRVRGGEDDE